MPGPAHGWKRITDRKEILNTIKHLRDGLLHKFVFGLDRGSPYTIMFDEDGVDSLTDIRPVQVIWHSLDPNGVSWTDEYGSIGVGCVIRQREGSPTDPTERLDAAMLQVGGVIVPKKEFSSVNKKYTVIKSRRGILVYLETKYFLTSKVLKQFAKGTASGEHSIKPQSYIKDTRTLWHVVPEWVWQTVVSRMVRSHAPNPEVLKRLRARELKKLDEDMDPSRLTPGNSGE